MSTTTLLEPTSERYRPRPDVYQPSPESRAAMFGNLLAALMEGDNLGYDAEQDQKDHLDFIWDDSRQLAIAEGGKQLGVFCRSSVLVPEGFGDLRPSEDGSVQIFLEPNLVVVTLGLDERRNLTHSITPART